MPNDCGGSCFAGHGPSPSGLNHPYLASGNCGSAAGLSHTIGMRFQSAQSLMPLLLEFSSLPSSLLYFLMVQCLISRRPPPEGAIASLFNLPPSETTTTTFVRSHLAGNLITPNLRINFATRNRWGHFNNPLYCHPSFPSVDFPPGYGIKASRMPVSLDLLCSNAL
ncbi:hypothetical protein LINGRAHAP2_LOCUS19893 [Linum grandiflorum]